MKGGKEIYPSASHTPGLSLSLGLLKALLFFKQKIYILKMGIYIWYHLPRWTDKDVLTNSQRYSHLRFGASEAERHEERLREYPNVQIS